MAAGYLRKDIRGSALVTVIIAMLFIGIIASIVISISHSTLMNSRTGEKSTKNFYEDEVALDEFRSKLKEKADEAVKEAYERWLREYTKLGNELSGTALSDKFDEIFAEVFRNKIKDYFAVKYIDEFGNEQTTPLGDPDKYKDLLDSDVRPIIDMTDIKNIKIVGIKVTETDGENVTTITTDMVLHIAPPTVRVGSHIGADTKIADYALIADDKVVLTNGTNISVKGNIYGQNEIAIVGSGTTKVALHSDAIVSRNTLSTNNNAELTVDGNVSEYSTIWVDNILMQRGKKSTIDIKGICNVYDDLTIDGDGSEFKLSGEHSEYHGYSTSDEPRDSSNNGSIVVNGKNVKLNLLSAKRLWLFGKNYVSVPQQYGYPDGAHASFMLGDSVSFRSLQAAYMLPGECIVGIGHNPMSEDEFLHEFSPRYMSHSVDGTMNSALKASEVSQVFNLGTTTTSSIRVEAYLNATQPAFWAYATYYDGSVLYYLYMNFKDPGMAAEYFQAYSQNLKDDVMKSRLSLANKDGGNASFAVYTGNKSSDETGMELLDSAAKSGNDRMNWRVVNTGNVLSFDGSTYTMFGKNADYTESFVFNQSDTLKNQYDNIKTTLNTTSPGEISIATTKTLGVNFDNIDDNAYVAAADGSEKKTTYSVQLITQKDASNNDVPVTFNLTGSERPAYMIGVSGTEGGSLYIDSDGFLYYGNYAGTSNHACDKDGNELKDAGGARLSVKAGIIVVKGDVYLNSADFWGTVIASGNIYVSGSNSAVKVAFANVKQLLQTNEIVMPYFSIIDDTNDGPLDFSNLIGLDFDNWRKD